MVHQVGAGSTELTHRKGAGTVELTAWWNEDDDEGTPVRTPAELDALLAQARELDYPVLLELLDAADPYRVILDVGLNGDRGVLYYSGEDDQDGCYSKSGAASDMSRPDRILYYYMLADREFPRSAEVEPVDVVLRACHEYMESDGARPSAVDWQPRSVLRQAAQ